MRTMILAVTAVTVMQATAWAEGTFPVAPETAAQREARLAWWREARFGMFIHWGPVTLTGKELSWSRANSNPKCPNKGPTPVAVYDNLYQQFNPTKFEASQWVKLAQDAGMKYMVLTAKHCDGFLLWDSKVDSYNIMSTPFNRDVCGELAQAAHQAGMRLGWYYSPMDWRDPDFRTDKNDQFVQRMQGELKELLSNYGRIDLMWFDTDGGPALYDQQNTYGIVKGLQPAIIIDNRLDMGSMKAYHDQALYPNTDYYTPEQRISGYDDVRPWEACMTVSRVNQWSYRPGGGVKPFDQILGMLVSCATRDGNLLLDVGPDPTGVIPSDQADVLLQVGEWLKQNGESIYGTRGGPFKPGAYGGTTRKAGEVYVHVEKWPAEGPLRLPKLPAILQGARLLSGGPVEAKQTNSGIEISVAPNDRAKVDTVVALKFDSNMMGVQAMDVPPERKPSQP